MHIFDGFKTYIGIFISLVAGIMSALDANIVADALGLNGQGRAITSIAFVVVGVIIAFYGRRDAQRKINEGIGK